MCVRVCICVVGGRVGSNSAVFSSPVFYPSPPGKVTLRGVRRLISREAALLSRLRKGELIFFFIRVRQAIFHHKLEINWNHRFARDQIRMTAASTVSLVCITVSNFPYPLYRKEHQHVEPIYQNFSKIKIRKQKYV